MATPVAGSDLNAIAGPIQQTLANNYLDFSNGWAQQYLPELYEAEVERYGNRMLSGFLAKVGAEEAMQSDKIIWSEQGRLHISADTVADGTALAADKLEFATVADAQLFRMNDTVLLYCTADGTTAANVGKTLKGIVTATDYTNKHVTVIPYTQATIDTTFTAASATFKVFVYGTEFKKGVSLSDGVHDRESLTPSFHTFSNKPIIMRDKYHVNGSDTAQIGWVEVTGEDGQNGYMWYLKAEGDTRSRFNDYLEMSMLEAERATGTQLDTFLGTGGSGTGEEAGTEGLFQAITKRGHVTTETFISTPGQNLANDLGTIDAILKKLDKEGAIEENMLYLDRTESLGFDDMLGQINNGHSTGVSYGLFDNSSDMALNLGFSGMRRGSYDFYKTDWKYLNDKQAYGSMPAATGSATHTKIAGVLCPAGVSSVYDQTMGKNMKRPFLHIRYRASQTDNRRLKTWITGSVGGNITSDLDAMEVNYLSERCLVAQATNNFMLFKN